MLGLKKSVEVTYLKTDTTVSQNCSILIIGPLNLQNEFFSYVIQKELAAPCSIYDKELIAFSRFIPADITEKKLILIDAEDNCLDEVMLSVSMNPTFSDSYVALINLKLNAGIEKKALSRNIRGFFYKDDHFEIFLKGVRKILEGEIWVSHSILLQCVYEGLREKDANTEEKTCLTAREVEILALLRVGSTNDDIAKKMFISTNTVKTHLYNIFKKIKVSNRLQASQWAAVNIPS